MPFCNATCVLATVTALPTTPVAWMTSLPCVAWMRLVRLELVVICCSTLLNCTSSEVKVLLSIGVDGSWFFNCVSSRLRKSVKLLVSEVSAFGVDALPEVLDAFAAAAVLVVAAVVDMDGLLQAVMSTPARCQPGEAAAIAAGTE